MQQNGTATLILHTGNLSTFSNQSERGRLERGGGGDLCGPLGYSCYAQGLFFKISLKSEENNDLYLWFKIFFLELIITVDGDKFVTEATEITLNIEHYKNYPIYSDCYCKTIET